ncbi:MAG TPA: ProQ/FinO family protein [Noviherbaspirillum sp.]|uniref:ProQ/FinO family protein n=1 Tax=Noviherbaspirillum sp. TaxID=1926288 RepID=UPI002B492AA9|nr:ProQ/FinO family protein [Noviherbaspirillum sp.]HJV84499.1 ProQ/FinO family protein [Noviherbaspirillum sp.]
MNTPQPSTSPIPAARALLKQLQEQFPVLGEFKPLAIGIDKQIHAQVPGIDKKLLRIALSIQTNSLRYLKTMEKAEARFNLDGSAAGAVDETHRKHASDTLRERFKKQMEQKKAQEAEKKAKEEEARAERRRVEKLQQLAEKFSPRR